jgi:hypothetical protein
VGRFRRSLQPRHKVASAVITVRGGTFHSFDSHRLSGLGYLVMLPSHAIVLTRNDCPYTVYLLGLDRRMIDMKQRNVEPGSESIGFRRTCETRHCWHVAEMILYYLFMKRWETSPFLRTPQLEGESLASFCNTFSSNLPSPFPCISSFLLPQLGQ